jgi:predicted aspartyl protease
MVAVRATVNGVLWLPLLVDTGAQPMAISPVAAARLGLDRVRPLRYQSLSGVGQTAPLPVVRLDSVQVGATVVRNLEAFIFDLPPFFRADGVIGLTFLRRFRVSLEFDTRTLVLRLPPHPRPSTAVP